MTEDDRIKEVFCQCISDETTGMCMRQGCPCDNTDCENHNSAVLELLSTAR